ncbi:hypothetical protein ACJJIL_14700 [Microbulbifer sp. EKSA005]|uniref:hypothetical protein n=2 Tax=Microbulbifer TaxID=48073 RepID=UPI004041B559
MTEINVSVEAEMKSDSEAKVFAKNMKSAAKSNEYDFYKTINSLSRKSIEKDYQELTIENISRSKNLVYITAYSGRSSSINWLGMSISKLGVKKLYMREGWDEGSFNYYYLNGDAVCKKAFDGKVVPKLSPEDIEINKRLFLPEGRVKVTATLEAYEEISGGKGKKLLMEFLTSRNEKFYYQGEGELTDLVSEDYESLTEFNASFERGMLKGEYVSFAKRPSEIAYSFNEEVMRQKHPEMFHKRVEDLHTVAKCPFCGSSLRTEKAKQCPSCYKSWRE